MNALSSITPMAPAAEAWTEDRVGLLRYHYDVGLTAAESAVLLGGVTKNAVISKRHRLGLTGQARSLRPTVRPLQKRRPLRPRCEPNFRCEPLPRMDPDPPPYARPRPLAQHQAGECLWPLGPVETPGDWRTLFCCAPVMAERRYCAVHLARARR